MRLFHRLHLSHRAACAAPADAAAAGEAIPRYPPFLRGLPAASVAQVVATQRDLVAELQDALAFTDRRFAELVVPVIERYAAFVHLLPASETHHHRGAGGLFRHGLEVACHAARASRGMVFALDHSPGDRRELEPRWRLAAGLAGLCHDLGKPVCDVAVTDPTGRTQWRPLLESVSGWARAHAVDRYFLRWRERRHRRHAAFGLLVMERVLTPAVGSWLTEADPDVLQALLAAVAGLNDDAVVGPLVSAADAASVAEDLRAQHVDPDAVALGLPVDRYLLDAMRRLVRGGRWQINVPGGRLWLFPEGLHVVWPPGAEDIVTLLAADGVPGIPRDPDTLADILLERAHAVPCTEAGRAGRYWRIAPALLARDGQVIELAMLRLVSPALVLAGEPPAAAEVVQPVAVAQAPIPGAAAVPAPQRTDEPAAGGAAAVATPSPTTATDPTAVTGGRAADADAASGTAQESAEAWCRARGPGGEGLLALARRAAADATVGESLHRLASGQLLVPFPDGLAGLGAPPQALLEDLANAGLLSTEPLAPLRHVREIDGRRGVVLSVEASERFRTLMGNALAAEAMPAEPSSVTAAAKPPTSSANAVARQMVRELRAGASALARTTAVHDGWFMLTADAVQRCAAAHGLLPAALLGGFSRTADCRVQDNGAVRVRAAPATPDAGP